MNFNVLALQFGHLIISWDIGPLYLEVVGYVWNLPIVSSKGSTSPSSVDIFEESERLKFRLSWAKNPLRGAIECPAPSASGEAEFLQNNRIESPMTATSEELSQCSSLQSCFCDHLYVVKGGVQFFVLSFSCKGWARSNPSKWCFYIIQEPSVLPILV